MGLVQHRGPYQERRRLRPISMGETLRRLTGKAAAYQLRETTSAHLCPLQWGVNTSRACATIAHTARDYLHRHPDHVLLKLDIANAFNTQSRGAFMSAVATSFLELLPLAAQFYQQPTTLYIRGKETTCTLHGSSPSPANSRATPWARSSSRSVCNRPSWKCIKSSRGLSSAPTSTTSTSA